MEGFDYEIKNSPLNIGVDLRHLKVRSMKPPIPKANDFNLSFKDDSAFQVLYYWMDLIKKIGVSNV